MKEEEIGVKKVIDSMTIEDLRKLVFHMRRGTYMLCTDKDLEVMRDEEWFDLEVVFDREKEVFFLPTRRFLSV